MAGKGIGILALLAGKPKGGDDASMGKSGMADDEPKDSESAYADAAFDALKDGDRSAFQAALTGMVRACVKKGQAGEYGSDDSDGDEA